MLQIVKMKVGIQRGTRKQEDETDGNQSVSKPAKP
jgi:hypothetical protein